MPEVRLAGCRSRPLVGYLKALGVLRVVSRQADPEARGRWAAGVFELRSSLDRDALAEFFLERYAPTPVVSPWNGGSGFHARDNTEGIDAIVADRSERLGPFREAIAVAREALERLGVGTTATLAEAKPRLIRDLRATLPDVALEWLDAAVVVLGEDTQYPPLLGSGGNDGRYDFSNNYAQAIVRALALDSGDRDASARWLSAALEDLPAPLIRKLSLAHFVRDNSPVNSPLGDDDALGNPWDLILALEGSLVLTAGAARRHGTALRGALVAPFTAAITGAGYGSAIADESGRAELWLPLWSRWAALGEIESLAREARVQVGRRAARDGLDFARAAGELGIARGISSFERFAVVERAGQSSLAVPAGRIEAKHRPAVVALRSLDRWLDRAHAYARRECPAAHKAVLRRLDRALFAFAESGTPAAACAVLETLGDVETTLASAGGRAEERGLRPLNGAPAQDWLVAADDRSAEFALAAGLASLRDQRGGLPAVRDYLHGTTFDEQGRRVYPDRARPAVPRRGDPAARLAALHVRRHLDAGSADRPLAFDRGVWMPAALVSLVATGGVDLARVVRLTAGLCLFDFTHVSWHPAYRGGSVDPAFAMLALAWAGIPEVPLEPRPDWAALLAHGRVREVLREAMLRLRLAELPPLADADDLMVAAPQGTRLAAALLLRLGDRERSRLAARLLDHESEPLTTGGTAT